MIQSTTGLVLRTRPLTETSLIVHWLTRDFGRIATVAKGARRPRSPFLGKLDLFYEADLTFSRSRRSDLHVLREVSLRDAHSALRQDLTYIEQASYCASLIERTTEIETPLHGIFGLMRACLCHLSKHPPQPQTVLAFELKLLAELGQQPELANTSLSRGSRRIAEQLGDGDWPATARIKLSTAQITELSRFLNGYLVFHLERIPSHRTAALLLHANGRANGVA